MNWNPEFLFYLNETSGFFVFPSFLSAFCFNSMSSDKSTTAQHLFPGRENWKRVESDTKKMLAQISHVRRKKPLHKK